VSSDTEAKKRIRQPVSSDSEEGPTERL